MAHDENPYRKMLEAHGIKMAPPDHWIYSEGPSTILGPVPGLRKEPFWNSLAAKLRADLRRAIINNQPLDGANITDCMETDSSSPDVAWMASTWIHPCLFNVFRCRCTDEPDTYILVSHGDGGVVFDFTGPYSSLDAAKSSIETSEPWTDVHKGP